MERSIAGATEEPVWFKSAVDWWLAVILVLLPILMLGSVVAVALTDPGQIWAALPGLILVLGIYAGVMFPMRYGISADELIVRHGLVRHRIPLAQIAIVHPTRSPLSSPAMSLNRLNVRYGEGFWRRVMISPADRDGFLDLLARRTGLLRDGDRLTRRDP